MSDKNDNKGSIPEELPTVTLPAVTVQKMINLIGTMPYTQVANVMAEVQIALAEQAKQ